MPYSKTNLPRVAVSWAPDEQAQCVSAANAALRAGASEEEAIFACIHAAGKSDMSVAAIGETIIGASYAAFSRALPVEVFAVGKWNGMEFTRADLESIVASFERLRDLHKVPLKFGHNPEQQITDGLPAIGWVDKLWVEGTKLFARFVDLPSIVFDALKKKLYRRVSIELDFDVEHMSSNYPMVLTGVALLGADLPAVNTLADLATYLDDHRLAAARRASFSASDKPTSEEVTSMDKQAVEALIQSTLAPLNDQLKEKDAKIKELLTEQAKFTAEKNKVAVESARQKFTAALEDAVKTERITPAQREQLTATFKINTDDVVGVDEAQFNALLKSIAAPAKKFSREEGKGMGKVEGRVHEDAGEEVTRLAREKMDKFPSMQFSRALEAVLSENGDLAREYINGGEG